jgi:serine protease Do
VQSLLKTSGHTQGVLVSSVLEDGPSEDVLEAGDIILEVADEPIEVRFDEQLPIFNQLVAGLPIGEPVKLKVLRDGAEKSVEVTTDKRERIARDQLELEQWGVTARDLSFMLAKELKRDSKDGVLVTSVRPGGPAGDAKPRIEPRDIIVKAAGKDVATVEDLREITDSLTEGAEDPVPAIVHFDRKTQRLTTVVEVGIKELEDPGLEVKKAWLPVETQVLTRDIAEQMKAPELTGFIVTKVYENTTADEAGLEVGDMILAVDGEPLVATAPEDYEELDQLIRQYRVGTEAELTVRRNDAEETVPVELVRSPELPREMERYRDENFDFTVRNITFFDRADERWEEDQQGVLVEEVQGGSWAEVALLGAGDLILEVNGEPVADVDAMEARMDAIAEEQPDSVVLKVLRGIHTMFLEIEPKWDDEAGDGRKDES